MVTIFCGTLLEDPFSFNGSLEEVLKHSYGFHIADIPASNRMIHCVALWCSSSAYSVTV